MVRSAIQRNSYTSVDVDGKSQLEDKVNGLEEGADDYLANLLKALNY